MEKNKNYKEVIIKIDGEDWKDALDKSFKHANAKAKIDGFRPGKASKTVYLKHYGIESLFDYASQICIEKAYNKMLDENKDLVIAAQPILGIKDINENFIEYSFTLTLKPEVKLGKYKDLGIKKDKVTVTKKEIDEALEHTREHYKENVIKEGKISKGDIAVIDYEGFKDGIAFEGGKGENYLLEIGSNTFIPGFEDGLIGLKAGDEKDLKLKFPENYHSEDLKGKEVVFKVKVNEVKEIKIPEFDKEFFEDLGMDGIDSKEALENQLKENIKARKEKEADNKYTEDLLKAVSDNTHIDVPDTMINDETDRMVEDFEQNIKMQGITIEQFYKFTKSTKEDLKKQYREEALKRIKYRLILEEIIKVEKITVTDEEIDNKIEDIAKQYNTTKDEVKKQYDNNLDYIKYDIEFNKAIELLK